MRRFSRAGLACELSTLGVLVSLWLSLTGLLVVTRGKPEAFLVATYGRISYEDAFKHLDGISVGVWSVHSFLMLNAIAASWFRRVDVLAVLMIGPAMALAITLFFEKLTNPNWFVIFAVYAICSLVSALVSQAYWVVKP